MQNPVIVASFAALIFWTESASSAAAETVPSNWTEFKSSKEKSDIALVAKISKADWWNVCARYGKLRRLGKETREFVAYREHLADEDLLNGRDLMNIDKKQVAVGMTACGAFAAIGLPERSNKTTTAYGSRQQMVYSNPHRYVYVDDSKLSRTGLVIAVQE